MADGVSQSMAAFKPRLSTSSGSNQNGSHASSPLSTQGPITKVSRRLGLFAIILYTKKIRVFSVIYQKVESVMESKKVKKVLRCIQKKVSIQQKR